MDHTGSFHMQSPGLMVNFCHLLRSQKLKGILQVSDPSFPSLGRGLFPVRSPSLGQGLPSTRTLAWCPLAGHSLHMLHWPVFICTSSGAGAGSA